MEPAAYLGAAAYAKGLEELETFAVEVISETPRYLPDCYNCTSSEIEKRLIHIGHEYRSYGI